MTAPGRAPVGRLTPGRRRAEELAAALDGGLPAGTPVSAEVRTLVGVATALGSVEPVQPRTEHTADLRARLMEQAQTLLGPEVQKLRVPPRPKGARERRLVAAATAVLLIGGTASVATAAQTALPGQALYPIKRGIEQAQTEIASTPAGKGRALLGQATGRLDEVGGLLGEQPTNSLEISSTLSDFDSEARDGAGLLLASFRSTGDAADATAVRRFAADSLHRLSALSRKAPEATQARFAGSAVLLRDLDEHASRLCPTCAARLPALQVPALLLTRAEVQQALHKAGSAPLDNSHPVVVPAPRAAPTRDGRQGTQEPRTRSDAGAGTGPSATSPTAPAPTAPAPTPDQPGTPAPTGLPSLLPQTPTPTDGLTGTLKGTLDGTLNQTTNGGDGGLTGSLGGAVSTLLPDLQSPDSLLP